MSSLAITGHQAHLMARGAAYAQRECPQAVNRQVEPQQATCAACAACAAAAAAATRAASADEVMKERGLDIIEGRSLTQTGGLMRQRRVERCAERRAERTGGRAYAGGGLQVGGCSSHAVARRRSRRRHRSVGTPIGVSVGSDRRRNGRLGRTSVVVGVSVSIGAHDSALVRSHVILLVFLKVERGAALGTERRARRRGRAEVELRITAPRGGGDSERSPTHEHLPIMGIRGHQRPWEVISGHQRL